MVGGESLKFSGRAIDPDAGAHVETVPFDASLKLRIAIMRKPDRMARKEHRCESDIERKGRVIASAEAAAHICKLRVDAFGLEWGARFTQEVCDRLSRLIGGLYADDELEGAAPGVIPGEPTLGLEKHRVHRLGLEFALEHQDVSLVIPELCADLLAILRSFGVR